MYSIIQKIQLNQVNLFLNCLLAIFGGGLLVLAFPNFDWWVLAWVAFVPVLYVVEGKDSQAAYFYGLLFGVVAIAGGFFWVSNLAKVYGGWPYPVYYLAALLFAFYQGHVFALTIWLWVLSKKYCRISDFLLLPSLWVLVSQVFPALFDFQLASSQMGFLWGLQPIEFTGAVGLDWLIVLGNVLVFKILKQPKSLKLDCKVALAGLFCWFAVGGFLWFDWQKTTASWSKKKIGVIQPNRLATFHVPRLEPGYSLKYPPEMQWTEDLNRQGAEFVVWPEGYFYRYTYQPEIKKSFQQRVKQMQMPLIFQDSTVFKAAGKLKFYNSVIWLGADGEFKDVYHKRRLVPFGEYLPWVQPLANLLEWLPIPTGRLDAGEAAKVFDVAGVQVVPLICYETLFPTMVARSIGKQGQGKMLVNGSQNGWYDSLQQVNQHSASSSLRAIENRVPLLHVIYNGYSSYTLPNGQIFAKVPYKSTGGFVLNVPYSKNSGGSFYSRYAGWFEYSLLGWLLLATFLGWHDKSKLSFKRLRTKLKQPK